MSNWNQRAYFKNNQNYGFKGNHSNNHWNYSSQSNNDSGTQSSYNRNGPMEFYNSTPGQSFSGVQNTNSNTHGTSLTDSYFNLDPSQLDHDVWVKAANSNLVPTAGEFVPSSYYNESPPSQDGRHDYPTQGQASGRSESSKKNSRKGLNKHKDNLSDDRKYQQHPPSKYSYSQSNSNNYHKSSNQNDSFESRNHNTNNSNQDYQQKNFSSGWDKYNRNNHRQIGYGGRSFRNHGSRPMSTNSENNNSYRNGYNSRSGSEYTSSFNSDGVPYRGSDNRKYRNYMDNKRNNSRGKSNTNNWASTPMSSESATLPLEKRNSRTSSDKFSTEDDLNDSISQRERLTDQLEKGSLECLVCYEKVRQSDSVWSCNNCFHVLHLRCIIKWAHSSRSDDGWRCPACQNVSKTTPRNYYCFCGKVSDPEWNRNDIPHSCGEVCHKSKPDPSPYFQCNHRCTLLCHPGPCPPCITMTQRNCGCGKTKQMVQCSQNVQTLSCGELCNKELNCGEHFCQEPCHVGECASCNVKLIQDCYCGSNSREVSCNKDNIESSSFECGNVCPKTLDCGRHPCSKLCHPGDCGRCLLNPQLVKNCPCGKLALSSDTVRESCLDPVPTCDEICDKILDCGPPGAKHFCKSNCHEGTCPSCELTTSVKCRCGYMDQDIPCKDLINDMEVKCQKKCSKKRSCGRHKCNQFCCIDFDHVCPIVCNHVLTCGQHRCEELCHTGRCKPCWRTSFEELQCECGSSILYPPISCGTKPPDCKKPCSRNHNCDHPALHNCHSDSSCPPCTVLTAKYCHGMHELRKTVPCHQEEFSCGLPCGKDLSCGRHKCILSCHKGECLKPGQSCVQPCTKLRSLCGHQCTAPCHEDECPDTPCKEKVKVTCECGHRSTTRPCCETNKEYQRIATSLLASKMADVQLGRTVDLQDMQGVYNKISLKTLECNDECRLVERNRRLSIGLQIRNPDLTAKLTPRYSDFMRTWAKKDPAFCQRVHDKLTDLVHLAKQSKQKSRSYSFETMNREKRQFVHEYCELFGCESVAYDAEPKRNVVATAQRDKAWLPSYSLLEIIQRENGQRKVPVPVRKPAANKSAITTTTRLGPNVNMSTILSSASSSHQSSNNTNKIDYFNYTNT